MSDEVVNSSGIDEVFIITDDGSVASSLFFTVVEDGEELGVRERFSGGVPLLDGRELELSGVVC